MFYFCRLFDFTIDAISLRRRRHV